MSETEPAPAPTEPAPRRRRWWRRLAWTVGILAVLGLLVVFVLPTPLARFVVDRQLTALGITHDGVDTVVVELWDNRVAVGPLRLSAGGAAPAQIGSVELTYSFANLFKRRALIETFTIEGVDIYVRRLADGGVEINGIRPPAAAEPAEPAPAEQEPAGEPPVAFGMQTLAFRDGRLVFEDVTGGTLTLELARLAFDDFFSWAPETAQTIALEGALNGMPFAFAGTSTLFAEPLVIELEGGFEEATLDRVEEFTGPTGLERRGGTLRTQGRHRYVLQDGTIEGASTGTIVLADADVATPAGDEVKVAELEVAFDVQSTVAADRTVTLGGALQASLDELALATGAGEALSVASGTLGATDLALTKGAELRVEDGAGAAAGGGGDGGAVGILQLLARELIKVGRELVRYNLDGALSPSLALEDVALRAAGQRVALGEVTFDAPGLSAQAVGDTWSLTTPLSLRLAAVDVAGPQTARVGELTVEVAELAAETDLDDARIGFDLRLDAARTDVAIPADGVEAGLATLAVSTDAFEISGWPGRGRASGALALSAGGLSATGPADGGAAQLTVEGVEVALAPLTVDDSGALAITAGGRIDARGVTGGLDGPTPVSAALATLGVELAEARLSPSGQQVAANLTLAELTAEAASEPAQQVAVAQIDVTGIDADPAAAIAVERVTITGLDAELAVAAMGGGVAPAGDGGGAGAGTGPDGGGGEAAAPVPLRLGTLVVEPGSRVRVFDQSAGEAVQLRFDVEGMEVGPIDTAAPGTPTTFDVALSVEDTATLTAKGSATPLEDQPDGDVALAIDGFPLPLISPYASQLGGVTIESGELSLDVDGGASAGALQGVVGLTVADLFLGEPTAEAAARFEDDFGVPLGFAVGILKDGNGVIDFDLPVSGTVAEPSVDFSEVVSKAIGGALASVFPTNWIGGDGAAVAIEPAPFEPGSTELAEGGAEVADGVAEILAQKGTLRVRVCGKGAAADLAVLRGLDPAAGPPQTPATEDEINQVLELALERGRTVRSYLVEQHGISPDRIGECRTSYSFETDAPPRAEFQL
jgi:hypothetical protein